MAGTNPDLVIRVAANIAALQADMAAAAQSIKAIEGAVKGAGEATGGFVGWLDKMGDSFVAHVTEGVLLRDAIRELITLGKEAVTETAALEDLARATGINTTALQQFIYVGKEFGVGTDQMVRGVEQLSAKLANGDANATRAVQALGLSVKDLIASGPQEAFLAIAEAVGRVEDPMLKNGLAAELFGGKLGKILIPMLADLRQKMEEVPKDAIISKENIEKAHEFEVGLEHLILRAKAYTVEVLGGIIAYEKWLERQSGVTDATDTFGHALERVTTGRGQDIALTHAAISAADLLANRLQALRAEALEPLSDAQKGQIVELEAFGVSHKEIAQLVGTTEIAIKKYTDALKEQEKAVKAAAEEVKKWDELLTHLHSETFKLAMEHEKQWREESVKATQRSNVAILAEFDAQTKLNAEWGRNGPRVSMGQ